MSALIWVIVRLGWLLGVISFFRQRTLRAEVTALRQAVARLEQGTPPPALVSVPAEGMGVLPDEQLATVPNSSPAPDGSPDISGPMFPRADLEALLSLRWGVWLGSACLLFAGVFLIRYAAEQGLLGPAVRCVLAGFLGAALLAFAEWLRRRPLEGPAGLFQIDQAPPAAAAGGAAILFAAAYGAGPFYGLLPPLAGFAALAAASGIALAASLRFGALTAVVGLCGAYVTPALVASQAPFLPGLFAYLFAVSMGCLGVVRLTAWIWLGWANVAAGAAWVCVAAFVPSPEHWAPGAFVPASALLLLVILPAAALRSVRGLALCWLSFAALAGAGLILESLQGGLFLRITVLLLSPIAVWKARTEPRLSRLPWLAAGAGLLVLLCWALPVWRPSPEFAGASGFIEAFLPGTWAPAVIRPLLISASVFAAFNFAAGFAAERTAPAPLPWSALASAVPVLVLAVVYAQIERFQPAASWAMAAGALAFLLTTAAARARRWMTGRQAMKSAGIHAAGAIAALALGCAMLLQDQWLTLAIALFLPALPWIEARAELPELQVSALAVAALLLIRLLLNAEVLTYDFGTTPWLNGLAAAYAAPALAFAVAAWQFRRRRDDMLVAVLEAGAVTLAACFTALELRHFFGGGKLQAPVAFEELAVQLATLSAEASALLYISERTHRPVLQKAAKIIGGCAWFMGSMMILANPAFTGTLTDTASLALAYALPPLCALAACRLLTDDRLRAMLLIYAVISIFVWISLQIRESFHRGAIGFEQSPLLEAELWACSGAWLVYGSVLMLWGIWRADRLLRTTALVLIALVCGKVFLVDMAQLTGLWRVLTFLGLGLALIGLGSVHRRFMMVAPEKQAEQ